jgi:uncharacterized membrane protein
LSSQWNGGFESFFGHFFPADVGILGGLFLYGIVGMFLLLIIPLLLKIKEVRKVKRKSTIFILSLKYMLTLSILSFFQTGLYLGVNGSILIFIMVYIHNRKYIK